jgi:hypothetical protein
VAGNADPLAFNDFVTPIGISNIKSSIQTKKSSIRKICNLWSWLVMADQMLQMTQELQMLISADQL